MLGKLHPNTEPHTFLFSTANFNSLGLQGRGQNTGNLVWNKQLRQSFPKHSKLSFPWNVYQHDFMYVTFHLGIFQWEVIFWKPNFQHHSRVYLESLRSQLIKCTKMSKEVVKKSVVSCPSCLMFEPWGRFKKLVLKTYIQNWWHMHKARSAANATIKSGTHDKFLTFWSTFYTNKAQSKGSKKLEKQEDNLVTWQ